MTKSWRAKLSVENQKLRLSYICYTVPFNFSYIFKYGGIETLSSGGFRNLKIISSIISSGHTYQTDFFPERYYV